MIRTLGRRLFSARSFTPLPVVAAIAALLYHSRGAYGPGGPTVDRVLDIAGVLLACAGQALRAMVLGQVPEGTSGQGNSLEAATLNTRGPYAHVRNPLYVGNFLIVCGLLAVAHDPWAYLLGAGFFAAQYSFVVRAEEAFLRTRFGASFDAYCAAVPRWLPRMTAASVGRLSARFSARRALFKEHNPFAAWASGVLALFAWEAWIRRGEPASAEIAAYAAVEVAVLATFVGVKGWKHGWLRPQRR